jgi:hypothetical protein
LDKESEESYNRRQAEPLFRNAKAMLSQGEIEERVDAYRCGNYPYCKVVKKHPLFPWCSVCSCLKAMGTDFFAKSKEITQEEAFAMGKWQQDKYAELEEYWKAWLDNYPRGATV